MLERVADRLPPDATLIGWDVDQRLVPLLLAATSTAAPEVAHHFAARLHRLLRGGVIDLAIGRSRAEEPSRALSGEDAALALWHIFIHSAGVGGIDAEVATDA